MQYYLDKYRKKLYAEFRNILILTKQPENGFLSKLLQVIFSEFCKSPT